MSPALRSAWVIARRDYVASVMSRLFLFFLVTPLFPLAFGGLFAAIGLGDEGGSAAPVVAVIAPAPGIAAARARLVARLGENALPPVEIVARGDPRRLLREHGYAAVLDGAPATPTLHLAADAPDGLPGRVALVVDTARQMRALSAAVPPPVRLATIHVRPAATPTAAAPRTRDRAALGRGAQMLLFVLGALLTGLLLSNLIEERSNKVIEVLAAAAPIEAIFVGKLLGMLGVSLTGVLVWGAGALAAARFGAPDLLAQLAAPAIGWPVFVTLVAAYFVTGYLLLGAVFLGLGAHAASPRQVQILSMPITMAQLLLFGLATASVAHPGSVAASVAAWLPWSAPMAMAGRAALSPALWPHALSLLWQAAWIALVVRVASASFRRAVLQSGGEGNGILHKVLARGR